MTILDLQGAFLTVPCKPEHCAYIKFIFQGKVWKYIILPFGYCISPKIFTKILPVIVSRLHSLSFTVTFYLDDSWQCGETYRRCLDSCFNTFKLVTACGFLPNLEKSQLTTSQCIAVLGTVVDSMRMIVYLPKEKEEEILKLIETALGKHHMTIRDLARLIGKLISYTIVWLLGRLYYRSLEKVKL